MWNLILCSGYSSLSMSFIHCSFRGEFINRFVTSTYTLWFSEHCLASLLPKMLCKLFCCQNTGLLLFVHSGFPFFLSQKNPPDWVCQDLLLPVLLPSPVFTHFLISNTDQCKSSGNLPFKFIHCIIIRENRAFLGEYRGNVCSH